MSSGTVVSVVGTRPHLTKLASVARAFAHSSLEHHVVHSGQHYDAWLHGDFLVPLELPPFAHVLEAGGRSVHTQFAYLIERLPALYGELGADLVLVYGDTTTTAAAALAAAVMGLPVGHVEAGLREFELSVPEEVNKRVVDAISSLFLCPSQRAAEQLRAEGIVEGVVVTGDTALDLMNWPAPPSAAAWAEGLGLHERRFALSTFHRAANTDDRVRLLGIVDGLARLGLEVLAPLHPRTIAALERFRIPLPENVRVIAPTGYFELQAALEHASFVLTDSGGLTKEAYQRRRPVLLLDDQTEWTEAVEEGWVTVCGARASVITAAARGLSTPSVHTRPYGLGDAGPRVVEACEDYINRYGARQPRTRLGAPYRRR